MLSSWYNYFLEMLGFTPPTLIFLIGLENAGKKTLYHRLNYDKIMENYATGNIIRFHDYKRRRSQWTADVGSTNYLVHEYEDVSDSINEATKERTVPKGIIYMVDAADKTSWPQAKKELNLIKENEQLRQLPLLILGNKIDRPNAATKEKLLEELEIRENHDSEDKKMMIALFMCSIAKMQGYGEGFRWVNAAIRKSY